MMGRYVCAGPGGSPRPHGAMVGDGRLRAPQAAGVPTLIFKWDVDEGAHWSLCGVLRSGGLADAPDVTDERDPVCRDLPVSAREAPFRRPTCLSVNVNS